MKCSKCGKEFNYPPATSRIDGSEICRICSAEEALDAVGVEDKERILAEIAEREEG